MNRRRWATAAAVVMIVVPLGDVPGRAAPPERLSALIAGTYDRHGAVEVQVSRDQQRVRVSTTGFEGSGTVVCTNQTCIDRGLDDSTVAVIRDIVLEFKGTDEELQAVRGRSQGTAIFTDGFESGDLSSVRGTATCVAGDAGGRLCAVELVLRGRVRGPGVSGRLALAITGDLTIAGGGASWGTVDWSGGLDVRSR